MVSEPVFWNPNPFWPPLIQAITHFGQIFLAISQSDHLSLSLSLIPAISPCSQSQGRKHFPVSRIVVRKHSPPATFPANFSGDGFFSTPQGAPGGDLQFVPKHRNQKPIHAPPTRVFPAGYCISRAGAWGRVSHFPTTRFLLQARLTPTSHPSYLFVQSEPCTCLFWGSFASAGPLIRFSGVLRLFFLNSSPCTCLEKCSSTFPVHDKIRNGIITSIQRHVTRIRGQIWNSKPWWQWFLSYSHHRTQIKWP